MEIDLYDRLMSGIIVDGECWLWNKCIASNGYGQIRVKGTTYNTHRFAWLVFGNDIPEGHLIRHKCKNRNCCNPEHLETGTPQQNSDDMKRDGTSSIPHSPARGEAHGMSKITKEQALEILKSDKPISVLSCLYGVGRSHIWCIKKRKMWKSLTIPPINNRGF